MSWYDAAKEKLETEKNVKACGEAAKLMAPHVAKALLEFCRQSEEFAEKVAHGGSFEECMKEVGTHVKNRMLSDISAYRWAAQFYAKKCDVKFRMEIVESRDGDETAEAIGTLAHSAAVIDLTAFL